MACHFMKVSEEEIKEALFYPSDLVNTKTTMPLRVDEEQWIYTSTLCVPVYIHHYSPPLQGIVVYYSSFHKYQQPSLFVHCYTCSCNLQLCLLWHYWYVIL